MQGEFTAALQCLKTCVFCFTPTLTKEISSVESLEM